MDENQPEIVAALRALPGVTVQSLATVGDGVPDLLVGCRNARGEPTNLLLEVKPGPAPGGRVLARWLLNANEEEWHRAWRGQVCVVRSVADAVNVVRAAQRGTT